MLLLPHGTLPAAPRLLVALLLLLEAAALAEGAHVIHVGGALLVALGSGRCGALVARRLARAMRLAALALRVAALAAFAAPAPPMAPK